LYDTLASRLVKWKAEENKLSGLKRIFRIRGSLKRESFLADRLKYASQLASALKYLHHHRIIHRDLKPDNIGFDVRDDINIFDFGLARELPRKQRGSSDNTFNLTRNAGTPRYMAPEVASGKYDETCDIYSAGLLLWELITLKRPFKDQKSVEDFERNVWCTNGTQLRPKISAKVPPGLHRLLTRSWSHNFNSRPSAKEFEIALRSEISKLKEEECSDEEMDSELYSSAPISTTKMRSNSKRLAKSLSWTSRRKASMFDASVNTFITNFDQSEVCQSFRSEC